MSLFQFINYCIRCLNGTQMCSVRRLVITFHSPIQQTQSSIVNPGLIIELIRMHDLFQTEKAVEQDWRQTQPPNLAQEWYRITPIIWNASVVCACVVCVCVCVRAEQDTKHLWLWLIARRCVCSSTNHQRTRNGSRLQQEVNDVYWQSNPISCNKFQINIGWLGQNKWNTFFWNHTERGLRKL